MADGSEILAQADAIIAEPNVFLRRVQLMELVHHAQPGTLRRLLEKFPHDNLARRIIATQWARIDPFGLAAHIETTLHLDDWALENALFETWAMTDPEAAFARTVDHHGSGDPGDRAHTVAEAILAYDPDLGIRLIARHPDLIHTTGMMEWVEKDPQHAVHLIAALPECFYRSNGLIAALPMWAETDAQGALAWINSIENPNERSSHLEDVYPEIARTNLALAQQLFDDPSQLGDARDRLGHCIANAIADDDPDAALQWISDSLDGEAQTWALKSIVATTSSKSPARAAAMLDSLPQEHRKNTLQSIVRSWSLKDPDTALEWSLSLADPAEQKVALTVVGAMNRPPENLVALLNEHPDNTEMRVMTKQLARANSGRDGMHWAEQLPTTHGQWLTRKLFTRWAGTSPDSAIDYLKGQVPTELRTSALAGFSRTFFRRAPEAATSWATETITQSPTPQQDLAAIRRAVRIAEIPEATRAYILDQLRAN